MNNNVLKKGLYQRVAILLIAYSLVMWFLTNLELSNSLFAIPTLVLGIITFAYIYKKCKSIINPISLFLVVWFVVISLTSFAFPMMDEMSREEWKLIFAFIAAVMCGTVVAFSCKGYHKKTKEKKTEFQLSSREYRIYIGIIIVAIFLMVLSVVKQGGVGLLSENQKSEGLFPGYSLIISLPTISAFIITLDHGRRYNKLFLLLYLCYGILQLLTGMRWTIIISIICILPNFEIQKLEKREKKIIIIACVLIIVAFMLVGTVRGGVSDKQKYFIDTGLFRGTADEMVRTEIPRYIGMSQRLMKRYYVPQYAGVNKLRYTLAPIEYLLGMEYEVPNAVAHLDIYGYNAQNIITDMYLDAGFLWPIVAVLWGFLISRWYINSYNNSSDVICRYFWSIGTVCTVISFFAYIQFLPYWLTIFPFLIWLLSSKKIRIRIQA